MGQFQNVPGPSQADFDTLSEQIATKDLTSSMTFDIAPSSKLLQKTGNVVSFFLIFQSISVTDGTNVLTLPTGCRPSSVTYVCPIFDYGSAKPYDASLWVTSSGVCKYYGEAITNKTLIMSGTFAVQ